MFTKIKKAKGPKKLRKEDVKKELCFAFCVIL